MKETVIIWTALVPFLLLLWFSQRLSGLTGVSGLVLAAVVSAAVVWFPWFGHPLPFWSASLSANFSVIMAVHTPSTRPAMVARIASGIRRGLTKLVIELRTAPAPNSGRMVQLMSVAVTTRTTEAE